MDTKPNTLFLRLEGPLQAWGTHEARFALRRIAGYPTKSGVMGMLCAALGISRPEAPARLPELNALSLGVRVDNPGIRWWDFHTVGAKQEMVIAEPRQKPASPAQVGPEFDKILSSLKPKTKPGALLSRREYLADASFLVVLQGDEKLIDTLWQAICHPVWQMYLGRKSCPPSRPINEHAPAYHPDLVAALMSISIRKRITDYSLSDPVSCYLDWRPGEHEPEAPENALIRYDVPISFDPPRQQARYVIPVEIPVADLDVIEETSPKPWHPKRPRADYTNTEYKKKRLERLALDKGLCVFCKSPATTVQHVNYRRAGGNEQIEDLRALCRICHDAVTMLEYGEGMTTDRIDPSDPAWRDRILAKRLEIIKFRSLETRRRHLSEEEV